MFYLTPQERSALVCLLVIFCAGTLVSVALKQDAHVLHWVKTAHQVQATSYPLDINKATVDDLDTLSGIGPKTAQRILDYRQSHGVFKSMDDVRNVKGLSGKALEQITQKCRFNVL